MWTNIISRFSWESTKKNRYHFQRKSFREYKWESENLLFMRSIYGLLIGILTVALHWNFFFIAVSVYCLFESIVVFIVIKRRKVIPAELEQEGKKVTAIQHSEVFFHSRRYVFAYTFVAFYLSFLMITCFGCLAKWTTEMCINIF